MSKDTSPLAKRMKAYEHVYNKYKLPTGLPIVCRVDGKSFSNYTRDLERPWSQPFIGLMNETAAYLVTNIQGAKLAYVQSDEISIIMNPWQTEKSQSWFDNEIIKMVSISAALASSYFSAHSTMLRKEIKLAQFDSRVFILPNEEKVLEYLQFRQNDYERNSLSTYAREYYSDKELLNKKSRDIHEMLALKGKDWNTLENYLKVGRCIIPETYEKEGTLRKRWIVDNNIPIFCKEPEYVFSKIRNIESKS